MKMPEMGLIETSEHLIDKYSEIMFSFWVIALQQIQTLNSIVYTFLQLRRVTDYFKRSNGILASNLAQTQEEFLK